MCWNSFWLSLEFWFFPFSTDIDEPFKLRCWDMNMWMLLCKKFHPIVVVYFTVMSFSTPTIGGAAVLRHKLNFYQTANTQCHLSVDSRTICKSRKYSLSTAISLNQDITPQNGVRTISKSHLKKKILAISQDTLSNFDFLKIS